MSIFRELPPTAGFPMRIKELGAALQKARPGNCLEDDFKLYLNTPYAAVTYSGTAALYLILESLKGIAVKKTIIIPAFVCPLVALAIKRAGLKAAACDINKDDFNFNLADLKKACSENKDILAIVAVHLGGIPLDFAAIKEIAEKEKIFIIEDCAQSLGAEYRGRKTGALADFSFFSLCRGKGLTIYEGGVIVTANEEYAQTIDKKIKALVKNDFFSEALKIMELFGYWIFYRPELFWWAFRLPQAFWNWRKEPLKAYIEYFPLDFPTHQVSNTRKKIAHAAFGRLEEELRLQRQKANAYIEKLKGVPGAKLITEPDGAGASYPYLTLLFDQPAKRDKALRLFKDRGLGVSLIYLKAITDYDYLKGMVEDTDCPNARSLASRHLTLSTSAFLKDEELNSVVETIRSL